MIATAFEGFKRVWPEMPDRVAAEADNRMQVFDLLGALSVVRDWEMQVRGELTRRWLSVPVISAGGMALTAEQVDGLKFALEAVTSVADASPELRRTPSTPISRLVKLLRALFPATEPAAVRDGSDLVVVQRSHTAKAVQSWMTLDLWTDLGKNDKDFDAEYERQGFGDLWATLLGEVRALVQATTPAPAEPAEEGTKADPWIVQLPEGMTMEQWIESLPDEAPGLLAAVREVRERLGISSPVVPAPTETEAGRT